MLNKLVENKAKVHTRDISLATYPHTDSSVIVHGVLKDKRYVKIFDITGGKGADLLRMKIFSEKYNFNISMTSKRCQHVPEKINRCPGSIEKCKKDVKSPCGGKKQKILTITIFKWCRK